MNIPGENLNGVYSANEFLTRINLMKAYIDDSMTPIKRAKHVVVVGGGNVAMDAARCALRLGAEEVSIVYRRSEAELPARKEEVEHAKEEGIRFRLLTNPVEILSDDGKNVSRIKCIEMELGEPDASGRRRPVEKKGSEFEIEADCVIIAIGTVPNPLIKSTTKGLETQKWGGIIADENGLTQEIPYMPAATRLQVQRRLYWQWAQARQRQKPYINSFPVIRLNNSKCRQRARRALFCVEWGEPCGAQNEYALRVNEDGNKLPNEIWYAGACIAFFYNPVPLLLFF